MRDAASRIKPAISLGARAIAMAALAAGLFAPVRAQEPAVPVPLTRPAASSVTPVAAVEIDRFLGEWYEIARIPAWFQNRCVKDTTARYQLRSDGKITVINRCITRKGQIQQAQGLARVIDPLTKAKLKVSFVSLLGWRPFWGDYWVIGLEPQYRWLVVGDPSRQYGWILSRSPVMDPAQLEAAFQILERNGYPRASFVLTPQG